MSRIQPIEHQQADAKTTATLNAVQSKLGMLPNMFTTMAQSPAVLTSYLQFSETMSRGQLNARQREMIAIAVAQDNQCEYCLSAHAALGKGAGLSQQDIEQARSGQATSPLDEAILQLALRITQSRGDLRDEEVTAAREQGLNDEMLMEIIGHVALNILTNYVNRVAATRVDFPLLALGSAA